MKTLFLSVIICVICLSHGNAYHNVSLFHPWILQSCIKNCLWTIWFNTETPYNSTSGDSEDTAEIIAQNPDTMCKIPIGIEAQSINYQTGNWDYEWHLTETIDNISVVSFYSIEPAGVDFRVRYCCPRDALNNTTIMTTLSTSSDSFTCGIQAIVPHISRISRIFGEIEAIANSWPWMVYLQKPSACSDETCATGCSAILIDENHLITAAHCIGTTDPANITVIAGAHSLSSTMETATRQIRTVQQIFLHPQYNFSATDNDIAVLRVNISFIFTKYIQPACLPDDEAQFNEDVVTIGWGSISLNDTKNKILKQIYTTVVNNCNLYWPHVNNTQQLCVHDSISSHLVCHDNGSGAILVLHKGQFVIEGLASYVKECHAIGNRFKPHVYTRVSAYKTWINEIIE